MKYRMVERREDEMRRGYTWAYWRHDIIDVTLKFCFEKQGVLLDVNDDNSVILNISYEAFQQGKADGTFFEGMIPKLDNAFNAMKNGVKSVVICGTEGVVNETGTKLSLWIEWMKQ